MPSTPKGRPTPKAPQNRPRQAPPERVLTLTEHLAIEAKRERRRLRAQVAPLRRAFKGVLPFIERKRVHPGAVAVRGEMLREAGRFHRLDREEVAS